MLRMGIFGGLFDPPHIGHLILAHWVLEEFDLKKIVFIPAFKPPHKSEYSSFSHRYEMTKRAIKGNKNFFVSDIERNIRGMSYTVEVIKKIKDRSSFFGMKKKSEIDFFLLIGADQWQGINTWKDPEGIFAECSVIVIPRPGYPIKKVKPFYNKILISNAPLIEVSSTIIRKRVNKGLSIKYLVPEEVQNYIIKHNLYR
uniref:Probable nicotinate-nucleotide adenylyltransferase n=1 Tax=candidate division WOR-3 bacterium TaxID=2052148 RepID=A0A7C4XBY9_UNCW3